MTGVDWVAVVVGVWVSANLAILAAAWLACRADRRRDEAWQDEMAALLESWRQEVGR